MRDDRAAIRATMSLSNNNNNIMMMESDGGVANIESFWWSKNQ